MQASNNTNASGSTGGSTAPGRRNPARTTRNSAPQLEQQENGGEEDTADEDETGAREDEPGPTNQAATESQDSTSFRFAAPIRRESSPSSKDGYADDAEREAVKEFPADPRRPPFWYSIRHRSQFTDAAIDEIDAQNGFPGYRTNPEQYAEKLAPDGDGDETMGKDEKRGDEKGEAKGSSLEK